MNDSTVIAHTQAWLELAVIELNLCPFAKAVHVKNQIRYVVSKAMTPETLRMDLIAELTRLHGTHPMEVDTVLLIHPHVLNDFLDYNDFLDVADETIQTLGLTGEIQIASFHPSYQFADSEPDDIENCTNRSPYPMLHLLRENSIDAAVKAFPKASDIFEKNIETLQRLGLEGWKEINRKISATRSLRDE